MLLAPVSRYGGRPLDGLSMQKIDPAFVFELGDQMRRVRTITALSDLSEAWLTLDQARSSIEQAVRGSVYTPVLRDPCKAAALALLDRIKSLKEEITGLDWTKDRIEGWKVTVLQSLYLKFETLFLGDLQASAFYLVSPKSGFDTDKLIEAGEALFSCDLFEKAPDALPDLMQATRCIAFELPTAAGFHLHRGHESVLRVYWDCVTGGAKRPKQQNMGEYLKQLEKLEKGKPAVRSHLRSIKDFHRNPLMHPEQSLDSSDEAIDLLAAIRCSIGYMLQEIPGSPPPLLQQIDMAARAAE